VCESRREWVWDLYTDNRFADSYCTNNVDDSTKIYYSTQVKEKREREMMGEKMDVLINPNS